MSVRVLIVIAVAEGGERLAATLSSLNDEIQDCSDSQVLLVARGDRVLSTADPPLPPDRMRIVHIEPTPDVTIAGHFAMERWPGEYLVFLDEHAVVERSWLRWLLRTADANPDAGAVGSTLVGPDGRCHEAGSMIWWDGSMSKMGAGLWGDDLALQTVRPVDCASTAALLLRSSVWTRLGGLHRRFSTRGYDDADLCLRIRALGLRVLIEPRSRVLVNQGAAADPDQSGLLRDRRTFAKHWRVELGDHEPAAAADVGRALHRARGYPRRLLMVDDLTPYQGAGAGLGRMFHAAVELAGNGWAISHFATHGPSKPSDALIDSGVSIVAGELVQHLSDPAVWYDAVVVSRPLNFTAAAAAVRQHQPWSCLIYDTEALWWRRMDRQANLSDPEIGGRLRTESSSMRELEIRNGQTADFTVTVSQEEAILLRDDGVPERRLRTLPPFEPGVCATPRSWQERRDVGFVSSWLAGAGSPNTDGLAWFITHVFPEVRKRVPGVRLRVTGDHPPPEVRILAGSDVCLEGFVPDLAAFYNQVRLVIVPNRFGSGVKLKTVEAVQHGVPVVSTSVGAEGVVLGFSEAIRISDNPDRFAAAVVELLISEPEWQRSRDATIAQRQAWQESRQAGGSWTELLDELCRSSDGPVRNGDPDMEVRGLRRDIADREAFIGQLRAQAAQYRAEIDAIRTELGRLRVHVSEQERLRAPMLDEQEQQRHESARLSVALQHERSTSDDLRAMLTSMQAKLDASSNELRRAQSELQAMSAYASSAGFQLVNWVIIRLKGFPPVYKALQSIARALVR